MNPLPPEPNALPVTPKPSALHHRVPHWLAYSALVIATASIGLLAYAYLNPSESLAEPIVSVEEAPHGVVPIERTGPNVLSADYYDRVRADYIEKKASFVDADLSAMTIRVYTEGVVALEVPIKTKGREGSWWETPAGLYSVQVKEKNHFSSIGHVYQPWSMVFQGNFFIHGWPYDADGTPVSSTYSGGCIRLETEDAKAVYDLTTVGMPVLVTEKDFEADTFAYGLKDPAPLGEVTAEQYLVADLKNNAILAEKDISTVVPIASVTKLVTSLVGAEYIDLDKSTTVTADMIVPTSKARLEVGQKITVYNLLFPLLTESSNEAAEAVSRVIGKKYFVNLMNQKVKAINMPNTSFVDPSGAGDGNISTATDLFSLLKYIYTNRSFVFNISSGKLKGSVYGDSFYTDLQNFNKVPGVTAPLVGGKIGQTTAAEETYAGVFNLTVNGEVRPVAVIVLHSKNSYLDVAELIHHVEETYKQ